MIRPPENEPGKKGKSKSLVPASHTNGSGSKVPELKSLNFITNFRAVTAAFDKQAERFKELCSVRHDNLRVGLYRETESVDYARALWAEVREGAEKCLADMRALWGSYEWFRQLAVVGETEDIEHPSKSYLTYRIGKMGVSWVDGMPTSASESMAERLEVEDLHIMIFESLFREIADDPKRKKPPGIGEVLSLLKKHKSEWLRRLNAIDFDKIQQVGADTVFAIEFKNAVFKEAVLEFLDSHGFVEDAVGVRDDSENGLDPYLVAIEATAKSDGLFELNIFDEQAKRILIDKKHVKLEWNLLLKNAQRHLNHDKAFACTKCGAGYEERLDCCKVCASWDTVVHHEIWEQHIAYEQQALQTELQVELQRLQREQKRREKSAQPRWQQHYEARTVKTVTSAKRALDARKKELLQEQLREAAVIQADLDSYYGANGQLK